MNLIPFAALVDEQKRYLVENYQITYLTSGRDLLRLQNRASSNQSPLLIANPDYDNPGNSSTASQPSNVASSQRSGDLSKLQFNPLPGTKAEAEAIAPKLGITPLTGTNATENAIKQAQAPQILHIATHGFFLEDLPQDRAPSSSRGLFRSDSLPIDQPTRSRPVGNTENALLRSGLALAGFNPRKSGSEDGVLTALEVAGLNLRGTQLVVLSACETGVGDVANGEGVYGLRRALVIAGAESQLISLWKVDDSATKDLMVKYYDRLKDGRSAALREVQLAFLKTNYRHPYFWAAFIPSGDWRPLDR